MNTPVALKKQKQNGKVIILIDCAKLITSFGIQNSSGSCMKETIGDVKNAGKENLFIAITVNSDLKAGSILLKIVNLFVLIAMMSINNP